MRKYDHVSGWQERLEKIREISKHAEVKMRRPENWYVSAEMFHDDGNGMLIGHYGEGRSPDQAVESHWAIYANGVPFKHGNLWFRWNADEGWEGADRPPTKRARNSVTASELRDTDLKQPPERPDYWLQPSTSRYFNFRPLNYDGNFMPGLIHVREVV